MALEIRDLARKDYKKAIAFAINGMHFERYTARPRELQSYGRYFLYLEMQRASVILAAYEGGALKGVLMADFQGEKKHRLRFGEKVYFHLVSSILRLFSSAGTEPYNKANQAMFRHYEASYPERNEICFLVADPSAFGKGIGSFLLAQLAQREEGKRVFLFTDDNCTYQFYEHRGFTRFDQKEVELAIHEQSAPLLCWLYTKVL